MPHDPRISFQYGRFGGQTQPGDGGPLQSGSGSYIIFALSELHRAHFLESSSYLATWLAAQVLLPYLNAGLAPWVREHGSERAQAEEQKVMEAIIKSFYLEKP